MFRHHSSYFGMMMYLSHGKFIIIIMGTTFGATITRSCDGHFWLFNRFVGIEIL